MTSPLVSFSLGGRTAVITGGTRNNGLAIARAFGQFGARAILVYASDRENAERAVAALGERGIDARAYQADLADVTQIRDVHARIAADAGNVDILVNAAANRPRAKIMDVTLEEWNYVHDTNLRAPFFLSQAVLPAMAAQGWGRIINIGGIDAYWGNPLRAHNVAAKLGIIGLTRALASETARFGITVNAVVPGSIESVRRNSDWFPNQGQMHEERKDRIPMARLGTHADVAAACVYLASDAGAYVTGQELFITGGAHPLVRLPGDEYRVEEFGTIPRDAMAAGDT